MATIKEDYVSFETAKLLKEKGFDEKCDKKYYGDDCSGPSYIRERWEDGGDIYPMSNSDLDDGSKYADISAPTLQMAMKWLREVHNIAINIGWGEVFEDEFQWRCIILNQKDGRILRHSDYSNTYEQSADTAIRYCSENLI